MTLEKCFDSGSFEICTGWGMINHIHNAKFEFGNGRTRIVVNNENGEILNSELSREESEAVKHILRRTDMKKWSGDDWCINDGGEWSAKMYVNGKRVVSRSGSAKFPMEYLAVEDVFKCIEKRHGLKSAW